MQATVCCQGPCPVGQSQARPGHRAHHSLVGWPPRTPVFLSITSRLESGRGAIAAQTGPCED